MRRKRSRTAALASAAHSRPPIRPGHQTALRSSSVAANRIAPKPIAIPDSAAAPAGVSRRARNDEREDHRDRHGEQEDGRLEEGERGAVEVDADVGAREGAGGEDGQERPDAGGRRQAHALEDVEDQLHRERFGSVRRG